MPRVLLAEDNRMIARIVLEQLRRLGYQPRIATNGLEVLRLLEQQSCEMILMDCDMPEMDGYEATRRIRALDIPQPHIIAMTGYTSDADRVRCLNAGMDDFITKSNETTELAAALERWKQRGLRTQSVSEPSNPESGGHAPGARSPDPETDPVEPLIEFEQFLKLAGGSEKVAAELTHMYLKQTRENLDRLDAAIRAENFEEVRKTAHKSAGASATCGVMGMAGPLRKLEELGELHQLNEAPRLLAKTNETFEKVRSILLASSNP